MRFALIHSFKDPPVLNSRLISGVQGKSLIQVLQGEGLLAKPGISQGHVAMGLNMVGILRQNLVK